MKKIKLSLHCIEKLDLLKKHGFNTNEENIIETILNPESTKLGKENRKINQKILDENHLLRVIYEEYEDEILIITVYPARRSRYEEN